ncbi:MAG: hypothetical protein A2161_11180 [Candidatus Schekmanbacteria bacterium RBG_13_48_7]|uniref:Glycosyl transferase family 1 domain-containing protein n=1 Tax=Candidatus Schekmanbacteria bacterium RBG_13_48_7 TaxID=1817878 RepID=A0A1F7S6G5_9BACT|nr:MAG: hypothetical protein A2161_11180 [Candidatus Schekmanbacteria bacterium RBG_13_48_7]
MKKPRILILSTKIIFQWGGSEILIKSLKTELENRGIDVDIIEFPLVWEDRNAFIKSAFAARMIDLKNIYSNKPDMVIATRFPAYLMKHPNKVIWLFHQHRQIYELCGTEYSEIGFFEEDLILRQLIQKMDTKVFSEAKAVYAISGTVANRLKTFHGVDAAVLYPIPQNRDKYFCSSSQNYVLCVGRLESIKRFYLLIESLQFTPEDIRCLIVGTGSQESFLKKRTRNLGLEHRVTFAGSVSQEDLLSHYAHSMAVFYGPYKEDFGFSSIEAMLSRKPVITLADSGGTLEFVKDGINGCVCENNPEQIANKLTWLYREPLIAQKLGETGFQIVNKLNWEYILEKNILKYL